jgi:hypothetical protein
MSHVVELFYADPVDEDGNVIGHVTFGDVTASWGPVVVAKVPYAELGHDENTPHFDMPA